MARRGEITVFDAEILGALKSGAKTTAEIGNEIGEYTTTVYQRLIRMEKHGFVMRIQIEGERPMLWRKP